MRGSFLNTGTSRPWTRGGMRRNRAALRRAVACHQANRRSRQDIGTLPAETRILQSSVLHLDRVDRRRARGNGDTTVLERSA